MANDEPAPNWRNFVAWSAAGAIPYILAVCAGTTLLHRDGMGVMLQPDVAAILALSVIFSTAVVGFSRRKRPIDPRSFRNFLIVDMVVVAVFLLAVWGFSASSRTGILGTMGASEWAAAVAGSVIVLFALLGTLVTASAHTGASLVDDEETAEELRDRVRLYLCSFAWMVACGLLLIGLSLAGPEGVLSPKAALMGALVLFAVLTVLGIAAWRLSDELGRTLSYETGNMAFYLIWVLGSGWAMLAHLGFVAAPAPLDWVTLFTLLLFVASFVALGRRRLLTR